MSKVITGKVRFSYVALTTPKTDLNGNQKYSVTALLPKSDTVTKAAIDKAIAEAVEAGRAGKWNGVVPPQVPSPVHDGDGVRQDGTPFSEECRGHWVFTASTNADPGRPRPEVLDTNLQAILDATQIYSGMYGRLSVTFSPYFSAGKKGIGCYLNHAQKLADGAPLAAAKASASEDFGGMAAPATYQAVAPATYQAVAPATYQAVAPAAYQAVAPVTYQAAPTAAPAQIDPITGLPVVQGGVMGL